jgi:hypothetical protein
MPAGPLPSTATPSRPAVGSIPLVVGLNGTLVRTDLLLESLFVLAKKNPLRLLLVPLWLAKGRACLKRQLAELAMPDIAALPYREALLSRLETERREGRPLVLATAADQALADDVARHLGLFDGVLASDGTVNFSRERKRERLVEEYGAQGFVMSTAATVTGRSGASPARYGCSRRRPARVGRG